MKKIIGIDIGGTKTSVVYANYSDEKEIVFLNKTTFLTEIKKGVEYTLSNLYKAIDDIIQKFSIKTKEIIFGISCGGPLDDKKGIILSPPHLPGWDNIGITDIIQKRYDSKAYLLNDANACAIAEWKYGAGRGCTNMVFLTFGTGLGAGLILGGRLYEGTNGMAGEVGHIRLERYGPVGSGKAGSFEGFCSGEGIAQYGSSYLMEKLQQGKKIGFCSNISDIDLIDAKIIFDNANANDPDALKIVKDIAYNLGRGLSVIIDILNPQVIVIGSIYTRNHQLLYSYLEQTVKEEALERSRQVCAIKPAELNEKIGDYGAVMSAIYGSEGSV